MTDVFFSGTRHRQGWEMVTHCSCPLANGRNVQINVDHRKRCFDCPAHCGFISGCHGNNEHITVVRLLKCIHSYKKYVFPHRNSLGVQSLWGLASGWLGVGEGGTTKQCKVQQLNTGRASATVPLPTLHDQQYRHSEDGRGPCIQLQLRRDLTGARRALCPSKCCVCVQVWANQIASCITHTWAVTVHSNRSHFR